MADGRIATRSVVVARFCVAAISPFLKRIRAIVGSDLLLLPSVAVLPWDDDGRLLTVRNATTGMWDTIGGMIEPEETPRSAVAREGFEETGLRLEVLAPQRGSRSDRSPGGSNGSTERSLLWTGSSKGSSRPPPLRTVRLLGVSTGRGGQMLVMAGENIDRLGGEASFAALCGASPIPASSGKRTRHRLNPGGDRQANRALHLIAVVRLRYCPRTRAYAQRRTRGGKSKREIMHCLKRYIARELYTTLKADLADFDHTQPTAATTIMCGNPGFGINRT